MWNLDGGPWHSSGTTLSNISTGSHTVNFNTIANWTSPSSQSITVSANNTNYVSATYTQASGSVNVSISPSDAVNAGAKWNLDGNGNYASGYTLNSVSTGSHSVGFNYVAGWNAPSNQAIIVSANNTTYTNGTYSQNSAPNLTIDFPSASVLNLIPGASTEIYYSLTNSGSGEAGPSITSFHLSSNTTFENGIDLWLADDHVSAIGPNSVVSHSQIVTIPTNCLPGTWYILISADGTGIIPEIYDGDNTNFVAVNVTSSYPCDNSFNDYPYGPGPTDVNIPCNTQADAWSFYKYQCVSYVAWKVNEFFGFTSTALPANAYPFYNAMYGTSWSPDCNIGGNYFLSNACYWDDILEYHGVTVNDIPAVGSIAHWNGGANGVTDPNGHVAYVNYVDANTNTICISHYNWTHCNYSSLSICLNPLGEHYNLRPERYIHIEAAGLGGQTFTDLLSIKSGIEIFPNPTEGNITLVLNAQLENADGDIIIYNSLGQIIKSMALKHGVKSYQFDLSEFNSGSYIVRLVTSFNIVTKKFEIIR